MSESEKAVEANCGTAAATLILFSDRPDRAAEHLMIQRSAKLRFAPNALVFPGGQVDEDDGLIAADVRFVDVQVEDRVERSHRVAAIRETLEETGLAVGFAQRGAVDVPAMQRALKEGALFSSLLATAGISLDMLALRPWAQWHPRLSHRRFDTRFYIARHDGDRTVRVDPDEVGRALWITATDAIAEAEAGLAKVIFPTLCNLERLAEHPNFTAAQAHLATVECRPISPQLHDDDSGKSWISIPDDSGYPLTRRLLSTLQVP